VRQAKAWARRNRKDIVTVHSFLEERGALALLSDAAFAAAWEPVDPGLPRTLIDEATRRRAAALEELCRRYAGGEEGRGLTEADVAACVQARVPSGANRVCPVARIDVCPAARIACAQRRESTPWEGREAGPPGP
jgi:hypothetical protein